jgi:hypothetical protein
MFASYSIDLTFSKLHCQMSTGLPFEPKHCTRHIKFLVGVRYLTFILVFPFKFQACFLIQHYKKLKTSIVNRFTFGLRTTVRHLKTLIELGYLTLFNFPFNSSFLFNPTLYSKGIAKNVEFIHTKVLYVPSEAVCVFIRFLYSSRYGCYVLIRVDSSLSSNSLKIRFQPNSLQ